VIRTWILQNGLSLFEPACVLPQKGQPVGSTFFRQPFLPILVFLELRQAHVKVGAGGVVVLGGVSVLVPIRGVHDAEINVGQIVVPANPVGVAVGVLDPHGVEISVKGDDAHLAF
tara:strand:- start:170 stop:514 length:345 start_codon:yes stop_codon:yes gene_type:complete